MFIATIDRCHNSADRIQRISNSFIIRSCLIVGAVPKDGTPAYPNKGGLTYILTQTVTKSIQTPIVLNRPSPVCEQRLWLKPTGRINYIKQLSDVASDCTILPLNFKMVPG